MANGGRKKKIFAPRRGSAAEEEAIKNQGVLPYVVETLKY